MLGIDAEAGPSDGLLSRRFRAKRGIFTMKRRKKLALAAAAAALLCLGAAGCDKDDAPSSLAQAVSEAASTTSVSPSHSARQPRCRRIRIDASTSRRRGQLCSVEVPLCKMVAAKMGSTLFFAPWTCRLPLRALPPSMIKSPIKTLRSSFSQKLHHLMRRAALFVPFPRRAYFSRRRSSITVS